MSAAGTPKDVIAKLNVEINRLLREADVRERFTSLGMEPVGGTPEFLGEHIRKQVEVWSHVIRTSGAKAD